MSPGDIYKQGLKKKKKNAKKTKNTHKKTHKKHVCLSLNPCTEQNILGLQINTFSDMVIFCKIHYKILIPGKLSSIKLCGFWDFPEVRSTQYIPTLLT